jgi:gas vesicle protein
MKFIVGFLGGLVVGAAGAVAYSMQTGRDLREVVDEVRSDLSRRDLDALGNRLEARVGEMQRELEARIAQVKEKAAAAAEANPAIQSALDGAGSRVSAAVATASSKARGVAGFDPLNEDVTVAGADASESLEDATDDAEAAESAAPAAESAADTTTSEPVADA